MKQAIFTYRNFQIDPRIAEYQERVIDKMTMHSGIEFRPLFYNAKDGDHFPDQCIDYGLNTLFFEQHYDCVLILDIDCIPLSNAALYFTFQKAASGTLVGNAQRSLHLDNNEHLFIGSSCLCLSRDTYLKMGKPSASCTPRGDICEEFTYIADNLGIPVEMYVPESYEASPYGINEWPLSKGLKPYGIGTTFVDSVDYPMFYHLFESRHNLHVDRFIKKCESLLQE